MALRGLQELFFDVTCTGTPTAIAKINAGSDVSVITPLSGGFLQIPVAMVGLGFRGRLTAKTGNSGDVTVATTFGTLILKAGETSGFLDGVDLTLFTVSGNANVLHVMGCK